MGEQGARHLPSETAKAALPAFLAGGLGHGVATRGAPCLKRKQGFLSPKRPAGLSLSAGLVIIRALHAGPQAVFHEIYRQAVFV